MCVGTFPTALGPLSGGRHPCVRGGEGTAQIKDQANSGMRISTGSPIPSCLVLSAHAKHEAEHPVRRGAQRSCARCCLWEQPRAEQGWVISLFHGAQEGAVDGVTLPGVNCSSVSLR